MTQFMKKAALFASLGSVLALTACTSTISDVKSDGTAENITFPDPKNVIMDNGQGIYPNLQSLTLIQDGMTKSKIQELIGHPHFREGMFAVREWDYLFHFTTPGRGVNGVTTCQFKIIYDSDVKARSFFWKAVDNETDVCPPPIHGLESYQLSADGLFAFNRSGINDLNPEGRQSLQTIVERIRGLESGDGVTVQAHADRLGSAAYNQQLSQRRANSVKNYLVAQGVPANLINAVGVGSAQPVVQCDNANRAELIRCLAPNRRVEVQITGQGNK